MKKRIVWVGLIFATLALALVLRASMPQHEGMDQVITLPKANRQQVVPGGYLYASRQSLRELLTGLDIHFKAQGLMSDKNSPVFEYATGTGENQQPKTCVDFDYFRDNKAAVTFTLIPANPECFTRDVSLQDKIRSLKEQFYWVYAIK